MQSASASMIRSLPEIIKTDENSNKAKNISDHCIHIPNNNYGIVEDLHHSLMHLLAQYIRLKNLYCIKWYSYNIFGFFSLIFYSILWYTSNIFYCQIDYAWIWAIGIHVFSWILQIAGHRICEGNQPAFLTGTIQSFLMAPIFVVYDWCMYVGIVDRPEYLDHINNKNKRRNSDNDIDSDSDIIDYSSLME